VTGTDGAVAVGPVVLAHFERAGDAATPALTGITLALLALGMVLAALIATPFVAAFAGLAALGRRRERRARQARLDERMAPTEPLPYEEPASIPFDPEGPAPSETDGPAPPSDGR
jgi:hypothetical protein